MSAQRRRVLENSKLIIPADGVYIEGLDGRAYTASDWRGGTAVNSVIVARGDVKFRMALTQPSSTMKISSNNSALLGNYMTAISNEYAARADYNGSENTANIMKLQPSTSYAAGYCNAFTFPDGKTKGFLPSLGQLNLAYQNKDAINAALSECGGTALRTDGYYWSSTFVGVNGNGYSKCWVLRWYLGRVNDNLLNGSNYVRPFADIS